MQKLTNPILIPRCIPQLTLFQGGFKILIPRCTPQLTLFQGGFKILIPLRIPQLTLFQGGGFKHLNTATYMWIQWNLSKTDAP